MMMNEPQLKLCKDCRHFGRDWNFVIASFGLGWNFSTRYGKCHHPEATMLAEDDAVLASACVTGGKPNVEAERPYCTLFRRFSLPHHCGPEGRYWEPRTSPDSRSQSRSYRHQAAP